MKILFISRGFKPAIGGTETYINELYDHIIKNHEIVCIVHFNSKRKNRKDILQIVPPNTNSRFLIFLHFIFYSIKIALKRNFDIIHANTEVSGLSGIFIKFLKNKPLVTTIHDTGFIRSNPQWSWIGRASRRILRKFVCKISNSVITVSPGVKNQMVKFLGVSEKNIKVIPYGIDIKKFNPNVKSDVRKRLHLENEFLILFVGMFYPKKGLEYLIESLYNINKKFSNFKLILVGDEIYHGYKQKLLNLISKFKLSNKIIFVNSVPFNEMPSWYKASDIFILPSIDTEGLSLTCLEAGACGKPVIASTILEKTNAVLPNKTALIVRSRNVDDLTENILKLVYNKKLRKTLGANGIKYASSFNWEKTSKKTEEIYINLVGDRNQNS